jgi:4-oxalocrotonate tautomerase
MPIAQINIMPGRTDEQKAKMIAAVTEAIAETLGAPKESIRVLVHEVPSTQWGIGGQTAKSLGR